MGATKQLLEENQEQNVEFNPIIEVEENKVTKLIKKLENRSLRLSYSSIKNLTTPVDFMDYKLKDWKPKSESQMLGTACDLLLLTPELFSQQITVLETMPTTENQVNFCDSMVKIIAENEIEITDEFHTSEAFINAFNENYKRGKPESVKNLIPYIEAKVLGRETITKDLKEKAETICERLTSQDDFMEALEKTTERQKKIEFEYMGWKFVSYLDTYSPGIFQDLKFASDCSPDKFQYDLRKFQYDVQFGLYSLGLEILGESTPEFEFIVYDAKGNYSIMPVDYAYIKYAQKKVKFLIMCLEKMISEKAYFSSYNFFNPKLRIYKPQWIKGFDFEMFENNELAS